MEIRTLPELFLHFVEAYDKPDALRYKREGRYVDVSARDLRREVEALAYGLVALGMERGDRVALLSENRPGWALADLAILCGGGLTVPIYPNLAADQEAYILENCQARICFVSTREQLEKVLSVRQKTPVERVVALDPVPDADPAALSMDRLKALGEQKRDESPELLQERLDTIQPSDVATIIYTSGTTGAPKGVMLSHDNILSNVKAVLPLFGIGASDTSLSFLPLSHSFERVAGYYGMLYAGASIAYAESIDTVAQNMVDVRPTVIFSVPRLYEKMYGRIMEAVRQGPALKRWLFARARALGERVVDRRLSGERVGVGLGLAHALAGLLVFRQLRARTGGRLRFFVSGGAPLSQAIARFFWAAGLPIFEGYGLTETSPVISANRPGSVRLGTVGKPIPGVEVRIAEDGEILCKGPNVMVGYYRMPEETAAAIVDGWFKTGDIGHLDEDGFLVITDRKKELIKTAGGKFIAPQPIESKLKQSRFVSHAVVVGNRRKYAAALIVPNFDELRDHVRRSGIGYADEEDLVGRPEVRKLYDEIVEDVNRGLSHFETVKRYTLVPQEFSVESGELTPTMKVRRGLVEQRYANRIEEMYGEKLEV